MAPSSQVKDAGIDLNMEERIRSLLFEALQINQPSDCLSAVEKTTNLKPIPNIQVPRRVPLRRDAPIMNDRLELASQKRPGRKRVVITQTGDNTDGANVLFNGSQTFFNSRPQYAAAVVPHAAPPEPDIKAPAIAKEGKSAFGEQSPERDRSEAHDGYNEVGDDPSDGDEDVREIHHRGNNRRGTNVLYNGDQKYIGSDPIYSHRK